MLAQRLPPAPHARSRCPGPPPTSLLLQTSANSPHPPGEPAPNAKFWARQLGGHGDGPSKVRPQERTGEGRGAEERTGHPTSSRAGERAEGAKGAKKPPTTSQRQRAKLGKQDEGGSALGTGRRCCRLRSLSPLGTPLAPSPSPSLTCLHPWVGPKAQALGLPSAWEPQLRSCPWF